MMIGKRQIIGVYEGALAVVAYREGKRNVIHDYKRETEKRNTFHNVLPNGTQWTIIKP